MTDLVRPTRSPESAINPLASNLPSAAMTVLRFNSVNSQIEATEG